MIFVTVKDWDLFWTRSWKKRWDLQFRKKWKMFEWKQKTKQKKSSYIASFLQSNESRAYSTGLEKRPWYRALLQRSLKWWVVAQASWQAGWLACTGRILLQELFCEANASLQQLKKKVPQGCENPQIKSSVVSWYSIFIIFLWACFLLTISIAKGVKSFTFTRLY